MEAPVRSPASGCGNSDWVSHMCYGCLRGVAVVMELNPEDGTFRPGASPPGGTRPHGAPKKRRNPQKHKPHHWALEKWLEFNLDAPLHGISPRFCFVFAVFEEICKQTCFLWKSFAAKIQVTFSEQVSPHKIDLWIQQRGHPHTIFL